MNQIDPQEWKADLPAFREKTKEFTQAKSMSARTRAFPVFTAATRAEGRQGEHTRLRMPGGRVTREKLALVASAIREYKVARAHFTTCQTIQLHDLGPDTVCAIMEQALDAGIVTMGGGGDFPRNVMCSPLSGVQADEYFDTLPYAEAAGNYLMHFIKAEKMPRKLKVWLLQLPGEPDARHLPRPRLCRPSGRQVRRVQRRRPWQQPALRRPGRRGDRPRPHPVLYQGHVADLPRLRQLRKPWQGAHPLACRRRSAARENYKRAYLEKLDEVVPRART